ncbi:uncharacterized protein [Montipora capricornis]|uniref:uncharacterized protein n=1 Tax=Montipora capricornis TaxID=246305 RepID=UPI0035F1A9CB
MSDEETSSHSSQLSPSIDDENMPENVIWLYQFEPEFSSSEERVEEKELVGEHQHDDENFRVRNLDWCTCQNCQILNRNEECTCCSEFPQICDKNKEAVEMGEVAEAAVCITQHPGLQAVCLNRWVLQTAWYQYKQQYFQSYEGPQHKLNRHVAYRQLVRWYWGVLCKEIRVPLPSCAVCCIRAHFPPPGLENDFQFEGFHFPDE